MNRQYWENLQPFANDDRSAEPVEFDRLTALYLALQRTLSEARRLGEQVGSEMKRMGAPSPPQTS